MARIKDVLNHNMYPNSVGNPNGYVVFLYDDNSCELIYEYNANEIKVNISGLKQKLFWNKDMTKEEAIDALVISKRKK